MQRKSTLAAPGRRRPGRGWPGRVEPRFDRKGDRIDQHLDRRGDRIDHASTARVVAPDASVRRHD